MAIFLAIAPIFMAIQNRILGSRYSLASISIVSLLIGVQWVFQQL